MLEIRGAVSHQSSRAGMAGHKLSYEGFSFSLTKSYTKAWILFKMLEKSTCLLPFNTRGKAEFSKDCRRLSPVMGRKCARPPAHPVGGPEEDYIYPGFWSPWSLSFYTVDSRLTIGLVVLGVTFCARFTPKHRNHCVMRLIFIFGPVSLCSSGLHRTDRDQPVSAFPSAGSPVPHHSQHRVRGFKLCVSAAKVQFNMLVHKGKHEL